MLLLWSSSNAIPWESQVGIPMTYPYRTAMDFSMSSPNASPWDPNVLPIVPCHGIPNDQSPANPIEATCGILSALPIKHIHGAPMDQYKWNSMGAPCGDPNDLPIEQFHGFLHEQPQCKSMGSQCIAHRAIPWNSQ